MSRKGRRITPEERDLWDQVARRTERLHKPERPDFAAPQPASKPGKSPSEPEEREPPKPFRVGSEVDHRADHDLVAGLSERLSAAPIRMDRKTHTRLRRGKLRPEARIDLHGMTLDEAHPALTGFIINAQATGKRLVLVITGKGKAREDPGPIPRRLGVLRHQVPQWLRMPPLGPLVLDVTEAHISHGGHGAFYVYLRRRR